MLGGVKPEKSESFNNELAEVGRKKGWRGIPYDGSAAIMMTVEKWKVAPSLRAARPGQASPADGGSEVLILDTP